MLQFEDDLSELQVAHKAAAVAPAASTTTPKTKDNAQVVQSKPAPAPSEEFAFDDSEETNRALAPSGLPVIKPEQGTYVRFAVAPGAKAKHAMVHWSQEHGSVRCLSTDDHEELCCQRLGFAKSRFVVPVIKYTNVDPASGKLTSGTPSFEIAVLRLSKQNFKDMRDGVGNENFTVYDVDWKVTKSGNNIAFKFSSVCNPPKYRSTPEGIARAEQLLANVHNEQITAKLGKERDRTELALLLGEPVGEDPQLEYDDVQ